MTATTQPTVSASLVEQQIDARFHEAQRLSCKNLDRVFAWIFFVQWIAAIVVATSLSPYTWESGERSIHPHVWAAVGLGGLISLFPIYCGWRRPGEKCTRMAVGVGLTMMTALLIHITWGRIETHFHAFVALAVISFYREKNLLLVAMLIVILDHVVRGAVWPEAVFGLGTSDAFIRTLEHAAWMLGEVVFLCYSIDRSRHEVREIIRHQIEVEGLGHKLEQKVEQRTAQLQESEAKARSLFENAVVGLFRCAPDGKLLEANPAIVKMLGYESAQDLLSHIDQVDEIEEVGADERKWCMSPFEPEEVHFRSCEWNHREGRKIPVRVSEQQMFDQSGNLLYIEGFAEDISDNRALEATVRDRTQSLLDAKEELERERASLAHRVDERTAELKNANQQLMESARMKDEFLANMSHELRTPLNSILGLSEAFDEGIYGDLTERQITKIRNIESSGRHLLDLINEVLDIAKLGAGEMKIETADFDAGALAESCIVFVKTQAAKKEIELECQIDPAVGEICADQRRLKQVLVNLLSNAVKFTKVGKVQLAVTSHDPYVEFAISDTGIGISEEDQKKLFTPFVQLDSSLTREHAGTGLGLALVKQMAELHGGYVEVSSSLGEGSRFAVSIPQKSIEASPAVKFPEPRFEAHGEIQKAFVVEDSEIAAEQIARYLSDQHIDCSICNSGEAALAQLKREMPDLIVLDIQLPGIWGWAVLERIKSDPHTREIPVVIVSIEDDQRKGFELGASDYLVKPVTRGELNGALQRLTQNGRNRLSQAVVATQLDSVNSRDFDRPHILVVDDNDANIGMLVDFLRAYDYQVSIGRDGQEALDQCSQARPDLVLMDVQMPRMDGLTAIGKMKSDPNLSSIPVIAVTAHAMESDRQRCLEAGAVGYISKPVRLKELLNNVQSILCPETSTLTS